MADHGQVSRAFEEVGEYSKQIFGTDYRSSLAAELAGQGRIEDPARPASRSGLSSWATCWSRRSWN
jgi:hypothetical protein